MIPLWTAYRYRWPKIWPLKKYAPDYLKRSATQVCFGIYGPAWVVKDNDGAILMDDGRFMPVFTFCLNTPGWVIGPRDCQAASNMPWAFEWQSACSEKQIELVNLAVSVGGKH